MQRTKLSVLDYDSFSINFSFSPDVDESLIEAYYTADKIKSVLSVALDYMIQQHNTGLVFPYFQKLTNADTKSFEVDVYLTDREEAKELNNEFRNKNYATNILSYPSELPEVMLEILPSIMVGELVLCHEVISQQATEQGKTIQDHIDHLFVHGFLHLLGFDHDLGDAEREEMENFEIEIMQLLGIRNPYICS